MPSPLSNRPRDSASAARPAAPAAPPAPPRATAPTNPGEGPAHPRAPLGKFNLTASPLVEAPPLTGLGCRGLQSWGHCSRGLRWSGGCRQEDAALRQSQGGRPKPR
eukprot:bmy_01592T0